MTADSKVQRIELSKEADFRLGGVLVRPSIRQVESAHSTETLQPRVMQVLVMLARHRGQVVSRDDLTEACWEGRVVGEDALNRCIQVLRRLGETHHAFHLDTVPKVGYRLQSTEPSALDEAATVTEADALLDAHSGNPGPKSSSSKSASERRRWIVPAAAISAALVVLATTTEVFTLREAPPIAGRIAYFGFDSAPEDKEADAVAAATSSDILNTFAALQRDVAASTATDGVEPKKRIERALELRSQYVVSGVVARRGAAMSVSIRVEDAASQTALWSEILEGNPLNPSAIASRTAALLNDRIACVITARASLNTDDMRIVARLPKACESIRSASPGSAERWGELAKLVPNSAWALASESIAWFNAIPSAPPTAVASMQARAVESLRRAERIDPNEQNVQIAKVRVAQHRGASLFEQEQLLIAGLEKAGQGANLNGNYAAFLNSVGRVKDSVSFMNRALALDPLSAPKMLGLAETLVRNKAFSEAESVFKRRHTRFPDDAEWQSHLIVALFHGVGDVDAVLADPPPSATTESMACMRDIVRYARGTALNSLRDAGRRAAECQATGALQPGRAEHLQALLGDFDAVFARDAGDFRRFVFDPKLAQLRADPRFASLMEDRGLIAYWHASNRQPDFCAMEGVPVCADLVKK